MSKKLQVWLPLLLSGAMSLGIFLGYKMKEELPGSQFFSIQKEHPLEQVLDLIRKKYADDVNIDSLSDTAIEAVLSKLDPHSLLLSKTAVLRDKEQLEGSFCGVGIEYRIYKDTIHIVSILPNGSADKAGLLPGDQLIKIGDSTVSGVKIEEEHLTKMIRGDLGSMLSLQIQRHSERKTVVLKRDIILTSSVYAGYMLNDSIGYIRLSMFTVKTHADFLRALETLQKQGMKKLILDLRDNGGGILEEATKIADDFLSGDKLITYTEGKHNPRKEYRCQAEGSFENGPLVVLVNENSASASEVLSGALQDWDRATIIGRRTFGKGLVQEQYDLNDGSALRLTVAHYYTPMGRNIQRPYSQGADAYYNEVADRYKDGEMENPDSIRQDTTKLFKTAKGRTVYGGGGIMPDIFIPIDTLLYKNMFYKTYLSQMIDDFAYQFYLQHETVIDPYKSLEAFKTGFTVTDAYWKQIEAIAAADSFSLKNIPLLRKAAFATLFKASLARIRWRTEGYYEVANTDDDVVKKALEVLRQQL